MMGRLEKGRCEKYALFQIGRILHKVTNVCRLAHPWLLRQWACINVSIVSFAARRRTGCKIYASCVVVLVIIVQLTLLIT